MIVISYREWKMVTNENKMHNNESQSETNITVS